MTATGKGRRIKDHPILGPLEVVGIVPFEFEGERVLGREGDTVASALLASGRRVFRTMPKSGEARGGFCLAGRCTDCLMVIDGAPSVMACQTPIKPGLVVRIQHGLGGAER